MQVVLGDEDISYYINNNTHYLYNEYHCTFGPAYIGYDYNGYKTIEKYYIYNGRIANLHRRNGPAIIHWYEINKKWCEEYYINGIKHRTNGPAFIEWSIDGVIALKKYYINGVSDYIDIDEEIFDE